MGVAYAYSAQAIMEREAELAEQRYRQQILVMKAYELRHQNAREKLEEVSQKVNLLVGMNATRVAGTSTSVTADTRAFSSSPRESGRLTLFSIAIHC